MCLYDPDGDAPRVYRTSQHRAHKPHKCCECGRTIEPGEVYRYAFGVWNGDHGFSIYTCAHCGVAQDWLVEQCDGFVHEGVLEDVASHVPEAHVFDAKTGFGSTPARLKIGMLRRWQCFDRTGLMEVPDDPR